MPLVGFIIRINHVDQFIKPKICRNYTKVVAARWRIFLQNMVSLFMFVYSQILWLNIVMCKLVVLITGLLFFPASVVYSCLCTVTGCINSMKYKTCYFVYEVFKSGQG